MRIRTITARDHRFLVNPMPVKNRKYRGKPVYYSAVHIDRRTGNTYPHPDAFMFIVA